MIQIDNRIGSKELYPFLPEPKELTRLEFADVCFTGNGRGGPAYIGIERKTIGDFIQSMTTGRLSGHQLPGLVNSYSHVYIIVEGLWRANRESGLLEIWQGSGWGANTYGCRRYMCSSIWNYMTSIEVSSGASIRTTGSMKETCQLITSLQSWWSKPFHKHHGMEVLANVCPTGTFAKPSMVRKIAAQLPGIGWERSKAVIGTFGTVAEMVDATKEEWMEIEGIGKRIAENVVIALHTERRR